jgi:hypothetical protein
MERGLPGKCDFVPILGAADSPTICVDNVIIGGVVEKIRNP